MKFLRSNFLKLNTASQIQLGVISDSLCSLILSVTLISIVSMVILNSTYGEIREIMEIKENDQINGVSSHVDTQLNILSDLSKLNQYALRSFLDNNLQNPDFINNFKNKSIYKKYLTTNTDDTRDKIKKHKIIEKCFPTGKQETEDYKNTKNIFSAYISILNYSSFIKYSIYEKPMFKTLSYYNFENNCLLYNNDLEFDKTYSITNFMSFGGFINNNVNSKVYEFAEYNHLSKDKANLAENFRLNPTSFAYMKYKDNTTKLDMKEFYIKNKESINSIIYNIKWNNIKNETLYKNDANSFPLQNLKDLIVFEFNEEFQDNFILGIGDIYDGFNLIASEKFLIRTAPCKILRNKIFYYQNFNEKIKIPQVSHLGNINDCFLYNRTNSINDIYGLNNQTELNGKIEELKKQSYFNQFMNIFSSENNKNDRQVNVPIYLNMINPSNLNTEIYAKILKVESCDITTRFLINSFFSVWIKPDIYLIKDSHIMLKYINNIQRIFLYIGYEILGNEIFTIFVASALIIFLTFRVSKSIGDPIKQLIDILHPKEKNKEETNNDDDQENSDNYDGNLREKSEENTKDSKEKNLVLLEKINFEDDYTIKKFFEICKKLIGYGMNIEKNEKITFKSSSDNAYDNIAYMKTNNLIIQEEKIEEETRGKVHQIFKYDSQIDENSNKIENDFCEKNKVTVTYEENSEVNNEFEIKEIKTEKNSLTRKYKEKVNELDYYFENTINSMNQKLDYDSIKSMMNHTLKNNNREEMKNVSRKENKKFDNVIESNFTKKQIDIIFKLIDKYQEKQQ